jgi:alpha-L-arabinofuranosidase
VSATLSEDGTTLTLFAVNATSEDIPRGVDVSAFGSHGRDFSIWTLADTKHQGQREITNSFEDPERITVSTSKLKTDGAQYEYRFPALSLTVLQCSVQNNP